MILLFDYTWGNFIMDEKIKYKKGWSLETIYEIIGDLICFEFILKIKITLKILK